MVKQTEGSIEIEAEPGGILRVITDFEAYPEWVEGIRAAEVRARDEHGRATEVAFEFAAMGFTASYTLAYRYAEDGVSWTTTAASGAVRDVRGEYVLKPLDGDTEVTYRLAVELGVPVPGFLKKRADRTAVRTALEGLRERVEG
jgi:ribosome-associated toxin RatA of RatAB toxin-antitoxin module